MEVFLGKETCLMIIRSTACRGDDDRRNKRGLMIRVRLDQLSSRSFDQISGKALVGAVPCTFPTHPSALARFSKIFPTSVFRVSAALVQLLFSLLNRLPSPRNFYREVPGIVIPHSIEYRGYLVCRKMS